MTSGTSILVLLAVGVAASLGTVSCDSALNPPPQPEGEAVGSATGQGTAPALASLGGSRTEGGLARGHATASGESLPGPTKSSSPMLYSPANYNWSINWTHGNFSCNGQGNLTSGTITCGWSNTTWTCGPLNCTLTGGSFTKTWSPGNVSFNYTAGSLVCTWAAGSAGGGNGSEDDGGSDPQATGRDG